MGIEIGKAQHGRKGFTKYKHFYLKSEFDKGGVKGGDNVFRVVPPIKSLAAEGKYSCYYSVHKGFVGSDGKPRYFLCPEEYDFKQKLITTHCPVCDKVYDLQKQLKELEAKGADPKKLNEARKASIEPMQANKRYYINAINQQGEIGDLELPIKAHKDLKATADAYDEKGIDIMDIKGLFLNFKKVSAYKGDPQVNYKVDIYREAVIKDGVPDEKPKIHTMTPEIINRLEAEAPDLARDLFTSISIEDIALLANSKGDDRKKLVDRIFASGQKDDQKDPALSASIPGTNSTAVGRMNIDGGTLDAIMPDVGAALAPTVLPAQSAVAPASQPTSVAPSSTTISDAEFDELFGV